MNHIPAPLFPLAQTTIQQRVVLTNIIEDKGSKYTAVADLLTDETTHKSWINDLKKDKYYRKATHNTYAYRVLQPDGSIIEAWNDDDEIGAGHIILHEMQAINAVDMIIVVTRYFGGVMLYGERFRHVKDATKMILDKT